ncbi:Rieske (2Fe-2S) protein [Spirillospora sp. NPDC047279]|uniref:Rieske (2Fe-2S) protein n=1 Tax=Spirillospora sp. NPDC047279 TaxID=3155478 RepID=UPI0033DBB7F6
MSILNKLENTSELDRVITPAQKLVRRLGPGKLRDALHGVGLGHPLHPALVQVPLGAWLSAAALDLWGDDDRAARRLATLGLLGSLPAVAAGALDWAEQHEQQMRVGVVHAVANGTAIGLYGLSLATRAPRAGRAVRFAGLLTAGAGGLLGGRLSFRQAAGANHAEPIPHLVEPGWHELGRLDAVPHGKPTRAMLDEVPLVVVRRGDEVTVLADRCSHLSGHLSDGELDEDCLVCPWHGSAFRLSDGSVRHGPATAPQPAFETENRSGTLWIRLPGAG